MKNPSIIQTYAALLLISFFSAMQAAAAFDPNSIGMVDMIQGEVYAHSHTGEKRQLSRNAPIYEGDTIEAFGNGAAVIVFKDGTQWDIYDESKLSILKYHFTEGREGSPNDGAIFRIHLGALTYFSGTLGDSGNFRVEIKIPNIPKLPHSSIYPLKGAVMACLTFKPVITTCKMPEGMAIVTYLNRKPSGENFNDSDKHTDEKAKITEWLIYNKWWFIKDSRGHLVRIHDEKLARFAARDAFRHAGYPLPELLIFGNRLSRFIGRVIGSVIIKTENRLIEDSIPHDGGGSSTLPPASPNQ